MKSFKNLLVLFVALSAVFVMTSCGDDDPIVIDPGTDGINVADGFYISSASGDPVAAAVLNPESVEDEGFASQTRSGFVANYVYLEADDYNIVEITSKEKTATFGGTAETITDMGSACDYNDYTLITSSADGEAFAVAAGLYKVTYDQITGEIILYKIETADLIGSSTPNGWGASTQLAGSATAEGGSWTAENIELRQGEWKLRFNCRWNLDRRIDPAAGFGSDNGYQLFTNFGNAADNLTPGNDDGNIQLAEEDEGIYTATANWSPTDGWSVDLVKTGDVAPITFNPDENQWAITGDATPNGWPVDGDPATDDIDLNYEGVDSGTYTWVLQSVDLVPGGFKFRANNAWDKNMGWGGNLTLTGDTADFSDDGGNIKVATAASYKITLTTSDDGDSYTANFEQL